MLVESASGKAKGVVGPGALLASDVQKGAMAHCVHCGQPIRDGWNNCFSCGKPIWRPDAAAGPTPSSPSAPIHPFEAGHHDGRGDSLFRQPGVLDLAPTEFGLGPGVILSGRYRIEGELGMGGMGRVYLARDEVLEIPVALKVLRDVLRQDPAAVKHLKREAKLSMGLSHPNVVRVHTFEEGPEEKFLVMEYVEGETLAARLAREEILSEEEAKRIGAEVCRALEHAHGQGVVHRDLKPGNILLTQSGGVKVADFGIARVAKDSTTRLTGLQTSGTLLYMAPEQVMGKAEARSDLYSLGVVLYEVLSGEVPFSTGDVTHQILHRSPEPLNGTSPDLNALILRLLAKEPGARLASAGEVREELDGGAGVDWNRWEEEGEAEEEVSAAIGLMAETELGMAPGPEQFEWIEPGTFRMGSEGGDGDERPVHEVRLTRGFWLQRTPVTQGQWMDLMGENPSQFDRCGDTCPVENVSWEDIHEFLERVNEIDPGKGYRLPTEAEWEYACRAGATGDSVASASLEDIGWYSENSKRRTHPVAEKEPNAWGLYDMLGNVWEWVQDWYGPYPSGPVTDPTGPSMGLHRVLRGGSWSDDSDVVRSTVRCEASKTDGFGDVGFRLARGE